MLQPPTIIPEECYRCGYDLRGIADEQPCPECGLLAQRSRRQTDELHDTRPRWLRRLSWGVILLLLAILITASWPSLYIPAEQVMFDLLAPTLGVPGFHHLSFAMFVLAWDIAAILVIIAVFKLTSPEGYAPADDADRRWRMLLRIAAFVPLAALLLHHLSHEIQARSARFAWFRIEWTASQIAALILATIGSVPLPLMLFLHLRRLAKRARSAHLAEHCMIVGIGTSCALLYILMVTVIFENAEQWGFGSDWTTRGGASLVLLTVLLTAAILFLLWSLYLLIRFAIAFWLASRQLRRKWTRDDRAAAL